MIRASIDDFLKPSIKIPYGSHSNLLYICNYNGLIVGRSALHLRQTWEVLTVQEVGGSLNAKLPVFCMEKVTQKESYIIVARDLLKGVKALSTLQNIHPRSCAILAAHALECALKAFLCHRGKGKEKEKLHSHDIEALWDMAHREDPLDFPKESPDWVKVLSFGHWPNLYFRYQEGKDKTFVHGGQTPALIPMEVELRALVKMVELAIKG